MLLETSSCTVSNFSVTTSHWASVSEVQIFSMTGAHCCSNLVLHTWSWMVVHLVNSSLNSPRHINKALLRDDVTLVLEHLRALLTLPLELGPALALGLRVLNKPLRDLTLPLIDVGAHSVRLVLEAGEARLAVVHEAVDPCAVHQLSLAIRTGGTALHFAFGLLFFLFFLFCFLLQNLLALSLQPRVTVIM